MERFEGKFELALERATQALSALQTVLSIENATEIERDAAIQRFEYTFEAVWKAGCHYLNEVEGIDAGSPKGVIRACREVGLLTVVETAYALEMADDRNLTGHTYDRALALEIYGRLAGHARLMKNWLERMREKG